MGQSAPTDQPVSDNTNRNSLADRAPLNSEQDSVRDGENQELLSAITIKMTVGIITKAIICLLRWMMRAF